MKLWQLTVFRARIGDMTTIAISGPEVTEATYLVELNEHTKLRNENDRLLIENDKLRQALRSEGIAVEGEG